MRKLLIIVLAVILVSGGILAQGSSATACVVEGLTPGYWKNHTQAWECYQPGDKLKDVFVVPAYLGLGDYTLLQALQFGGGPGNVGGAKILLRAAVAGLLNAKKFQYVWSAEQVIAYTDCALASNRAHMLEIAECFDHWNNYQAPYGY